MTVLQETNELAFASASSSECDATRTDRRGRSTPSNTTTLYTSWSSSHASWLPPACSPCFMAFQVLTLLRAQPTSMSPRTRARRAPQARHDLPATTPRAVTRPVLLLRAQPTSMSPRTRARRALQARHDLPATTPRALTRPVLLPRIALEPRCRSPPPSPPWRCRSSFKSSNVYFYEDEYE